MLQIDSKIVNKLKNNNMFQILKEGNDLDDEDNMCCCEGIGNDIKMLFLRAIHHKNDTINEVNEVVRKLKHVKKELIKLNKGKSNVAEHVKKRNK